MKKKVYIIYDGDKAIEIVENKIDARIVMETLYDIGIYGVIKEEEINVKVEKVVDVCY